MRSRAVVASVLILLAGLQMGGGVGGDVASAELLQAECNRANPTECRAGEGIAGNTSRRVVHVPLTHVDSGPNNICSNGLQGEWKAWEELGLPYPPPYADEHPGETYWVLLCSRAEGQPWPSWLDAIDRSGWSSGGPPAAQPTPAQILEALWAEVQAYLHDPVLSIDPPGGRSVVGMATFVQIDNPQVPTRYVAGVGDVTVWIDVDPTATLHPGEPEAPARVCDADGTSYVSGGGEPTAQAVAAGACAHLYERRTRDDATGHPRDRPTTWTGDVTITWNVEWAANQAGTGGTLSAPNNASVFEREVGELETVVVETGRPA